MATSAAQAQASSGQGRGSSAADDPPDPSAAWYMTKAQLESTPARKALLQKFGQDAEKAREKEAQYRRLTVGFLQEAGQKLRLPQLSIATAIVFYHRFYSRKSYDGYDRFRIATTCLFLAGKVEETPKKIKDVVIETYKAQHNKPSGPDPESKEFWSLKEEILVCERILLQTLGFDLTVEHAYRPLLAYVKSIKGTRDLAQVAWNFINDSLRTTIALQYPPRCVAAAAVHLSSKFLDNKMILPTHHEKPWYEAFKVLQSEVEDIADQILVMYDGKGQPGAGTTLSNGSVVANGLPSQGLPSLAALRGAGAGASTNGAPAALSPAYLNGASTNGAPAASSSAASSSAAPSAPPAAAARRSPSAREDGELSPPGAKRPKLEGRPAAAAGAPPERAAGSADRGAPPRTGPPPKSPPGSASK